MNYRPQVGVRMGASNGRQVRIWLLQLGAEPVEARPGVPVVPQHAGVRREEVAAFVHGLKDARPADMRRRDDHGSPQSWPRGSF